MGIVSQTVHDGIGHDLVRDDGQPVVKGSVARQDDRAGRVPAVDDQVRSALVSALKSLRRI